MTQLRKSHDIRVMLILQTQQLCDWYDQHSSTWSYCLKLRTLAAAFFHCIILIGVLSFFHVHYSVNCSSLKISRRYKIDCEGWHFACMTRKESGNVYVLGTSICLFLRFWYLILELFRHRGILELFRHRGILELFRHRGILELFRQRGILELFRQRGIFDFSFYFWIYLNFDLYILSRKVKWAKRMAEECEIADTYLN